MNCSRGGKKEGVQNFSDLTIILLEIISDLTIILLEIIPRE